MPTFTFLSDNPLSTFIQNERGENVYVVETGERNFQTSIFKVECSTSSSTRAGPKTRHTGEGLMVSAETVRVEPARTENMTALQPGDPQSLHPGRPGTLQSSRPAISGSHTTSLSVDNLPRQPPTLHPTHTPADSRQQRAYVHTPSLSQSLSDRRSKKLVASIKWHFWNDDRINSRITCEFASQGRSGPGSSSEGKYKPNSTGTDDKTKEEDGMMTMDMTQVMSLMGWFWHR
jgi:hypothetical protein